MVIYSKGDRILNVFMNGIYVGVLSKSVKGILSFTYNKNWVKLKAARPISLSLPLVSQSYTGDVVYNFFDNLLPDDDSERKTIRSKFKIRTNHIFDLLECIGGDCIGAIQLVKDKNFQLNKTIKSKQLSEKEVADILSGLNKNPLGMKLDQNEFRISLAGAQKKTALLLNKKNWSLPQGATPTSHIFKVPIGYIQHQNIDLTESCENEWLCLNIAKAYGFNVANSEVLSFKNIKALVVERFDRKLSKDKKWLVRLPQEDMCQALGVSSNLKYQADGGPGVSDVMKLLLGSSSPDQDRETFYRTQVLFWLLAAIDGHAKNFSIFIGHTGKFSLTPLYDIISVYPLISQNKLDSKKIKMAMALKGSNNHYKWHNIQRRHFLSAAKEANYPVKLAENILDDMLNKVEKVISETKSILPKGFPKHISQPIFDGMLDKSYKLKN